ncbi:unnamed protein product [Arctia plantaginis]|uniref:Decapping nuclease n=1 Tax=Arctia plantaginis TaxID=874455 RepID=A0A8S1ATB1_ARCPL|nr:unnamed protein product [Arctia plantaginis]
MSTSALTDLPQSKPDKEKPVIENEEFSIYYYSRLGNHRLFYGAQIDGMMATDDPDIVVPDSNDVDEILSFLRKNSFVELKTQKEMYSATQIMFFKKYKLLRCWCQCYLAGLKGLLLGFRNSDGIIHRVQFCDTGGIPRVCSTKWSSQKTINYLNDVLNFVKHAFELTKARLGENYDCKVPLTLKLDIDHRHKWRAYQTDDEEHIILPSCSFGKVLEIKSLPRLCYCAVFCIKNGGRGSGGAGVAHQRSFISFVQLLVDKPKSTLLRAVMWASGARRDKILALTTEHQPSSKNKAATIMQLPLTIRPKPIVHASPTNLPAIITKPKLTNINDLWSRELDFKDFSVVFDYSKEYENSLNQYLQTYNLSELKLSFNFYGSNETACAEFLLCQEVIELSPFSKNKNIHEEDIDIFHDSDDDKDKTYIPETSDADSGEDEIFTKKSRERKPHSPLILHDITMDNSAIDDRMTLGTSMNTMSQIIKESNFIMNDTSTSISVMDSNILTQFHIETENSTAHSQDLINATITPHELTNTEENKGLTKDGRPRKRQKFNGSVKERQEKKKKVRNEQNDLKDPCTEKCMKKCVTKFTPQVRQDIHDRYIALDYESQGLFIKCCIDVKPVMRRSQVTEDYKRKTTYIYNLEGPDNIKKEVCKTFFLSTLGYKPNNDRRITTAMSKAIDEQKTTRGSYKRTIIDRQAIKDHIMSYHPAISHYRREHAPKKLYLPSDITITMMHENFCSTRPDIKVSLEVYRKVVRNDLKIFLHTLVMKNVKNVNILSVTID